MHVRAVAAESSSKSINFFPGLGGNGKLLRLFIFWIVTKFSDMGAYAVGSLIGKHKMIPRISPRQNLGGGFGGAISWSRPWREPRVRASFSARNMYGMNSLHAIILGVILSSTAVIGDLIESLFKREAGVKDSGSFFPGIGGILDLLDSLLFNAPIMRIYYLRRHILTHSLI